MKAVKLSLLIAATALITLGIGSTAMAFHDGGVAECAGCHSMHMSQDGAYNLLGIGKYGSTVATESTRLSLMIGQDPTSTCLNCHASSSYGQFSETTPKYRAGGDFYWLKRTYTWTAHNRPYSSPGDSHGHNVVGANFGLAADQTLATAPGGTYPAGQLGCNSCHDPHGKQKNVLLLYGLGDTVPGAATPFLNDAPVMVSAGRTGTINDGAQATQADVDAALAADPTSTLAVGDWMGVRHSAYGSGMSAWCANCHTTFDDNTGAMHPVNVPLGDLAGKYNQYISTANPTGGSTSTAYLEAVPFETGAENDTTLSTSSKQGADGASKVMCLSCHRAHASAYADAGRWDFAETMLFESQPAEGNASGGDDYLHKDNGIVYADLGELTSQRSLCNKCHGQD